MRTWAEVKPGMTIEVKPRHQRRAYRLRVQSMEVLRADSYAYLTGVRLTCAGTPSRMSHPIFGGYRVELVHLADAHITEETP